MTNYTVVLAKVNGELVGAKSFYDYDDAVGYMADWTEIGIATVVDFATGEQLFTLVPGDFQSDSPS